MIYLTFESENEYEAVVVIERIRYQVVRTNSYCYVYQEARNGFGVLPMKIIYAQDTHAAAQMFLEYYNASGRAATVPPAGSATGPAPMARPAGPDLP